MKFPYGIADFYSLIKEGYFFQDRSDKIPVLEDAGKQLLFIRPRRFGKSLLLSMLENYYDINKADEFESLFGKLAIGKNPTPTHNQYFVMSWDFSLINAGGDVNVLEAKIHQYINDSIQEFSIKYQTQLPLSIDINLSNSISSFQSLLTAISQTPFKLYLLIDEYDNFANDVMMARKTDYEALLYGEGLLKTAFKAIKSGATKGGIARVFITGVSPIVMSDMTSGYNVATNIYQDEEFNDLCGFSESEIKAILDKLIPDTSQVEVTLNLMKTFYNGYSFSNYAPESVYNPTLSLYFLRYFQKHQSYPNNMLDENLAMDRNKLLYISKLAHGEEILLNAVSEESPIILRELVQRFGVEDVVNGVKDKVFMGSLLYYFGILTLDGRTAYNECILKIPNLVAKKLYIEQLQDLFLPEYEDKESIRSVSKTFCQTGNLQPLVDFLEQRFFKVMSNRDYRWHNEHAIKIAFMTLLFNDNLYMMISETEVNRRYIDISMILRPDMRKYEALDLILEFKYLDLKDLNLTGVELQKMTREQLMKLPMVNKRLLEAEEQARDYAADLLQRFGELRLHCFAVVALGLERVVWSEVDA
ncbi:MAG: AAA family ATPase [Methylococcaceae bacterium]|nr:AAA family ATPase [Methylococcaceae bacterium]